LKTSTIILESAEQITFSNDAYTIPTWFKCEENDASRLLLPLYILLRLSR